MEVRQEFRPLLHPKAAEGASTAQVVWARVKGYPSWPAQVLSDAAARKKLGKVSHKDIDVPVMFFGTLEIAWIGRGDIVTFSDGIQKGFLGRGKHKNFLKAVAQVMDFLACTGKKSKAPQQWWCKAPCLDDTGGDEVHKGSPAKQAESKPSSSSEDGDDGTSDAESDHSSSDAEPAGEGSGNSHDTGSGSQDERDSGEGGSDAAGSGSDGESGSEDAGDDGANGHAPAHREDVISLEEQAILKLPIEIRRLAGIKVVKRPHAEAASRAKRTETIASASGELAPGTHKEMGSAASSEGMRTSPAANGNDSEPGRAMGEHSDEPDAKSVLCADDPAPDASHKDADSGARDGGGNGATADDGRGDAAVGTAPACEQDAAAEQAAAPRGMDAVPEQPNAAEVSVKPEAGSDPPPAAPKPRPLSKEAARAEMLERKRLRERERREEAKRKRLRKSGGSGSDAGGDRVQRAERPPLIPGTSGELPDGLEPAGGDAAAVDGRGPSGWSGRMRERRAASLGRLGSSSDGGADAARPVMPVRSVGPNGLAPVPVVVFESPPAAAPPPVHRAERPLRPARHSGPVADGSAAGSDDDGLDAEAAEALQLMGMGVAQQSSPPPPEPHAFTMVAPRPQQQQQRVRSAGAFVWPDGALLLPDRQETFVLPGEWLNVPPPQFEMVRRNVWHSKRRPNRQPRDNVSVCFCSPPAIDFDELGRPVAASGCTAGCLNRQSFVHCDARACPCGELCSNKPFHLLKAPRIQTFLTENRGHGIRAMEFVGRGSFIIEYTGEVVDIKELDTRMAASRARGEQHFYIMELDPGLFIDARHRGNQARLLNSSCDPNCETQKWHDAGTGEARIGIFARRDIMPGEELTYDYFFEHYGSVAQLGSSFQCMCGAKNCRGTMDVNPEKRRDLGRRVELLWEDDGIFYPGTIIGFNPANRKHVVLYDDGNQEKVCLDEVQHRWLTDEAAAGCRQMPLARVGAVDSAAGAAAHHPLGAGGSRHNEGTSSRPSPSLLNAILGIQLQPCAVPLFQRSAPMNAGCGPSVRSMHSTQPHLEPGMLPVPAVAPRSVHVPPEGSSGAMGRVLNSSVLAGMPAAEMSTATLFNAIMNHV